MWSAVQLSCEQILARSSTIYHLLLHTAIILHVFGEDQRLVHKRVIPCLGHLTGRKVARAYTSRTFLRWISGSVGSHSLLSIICKARHLRFERPPKLYLSDWLHCSVVSDEVHLNFTFGVNESGIDEDKVNDVLPLVLSSRPGQ